MIRTTMTMVLGLAAGWLAAEASKSGDNPARVTGLMIASAVAVLAAGIVVAWPRTKGV